VGLRRDAQLLRAWWRIVVLVTTAVAAGVVAIAGVVLFGPLPPAPSLPARQPLLVASIADRPTHTLVGIGASGAWWSEPVAAFGPRTVAQVGRLLYSREGLALSQFRFNIGGGGVGVTTWWKAPPSFFLSNGQFDFNDDPAGVEFLLQAQRWGVRDLVGFVNSAPPAFTSNHHSCGGTLLARDIPAYALELAETVQGIWRTFHVRLRYVSPMNEPVGSQAPCRQEGMAVPVSERGPLVVDLARDLARLAPWARVIADESSYATQLLNQAPQWLAYPGARRALAALAVHGYDYPSRAVLRQVALLGRREGLPIWDTEICCFDGEGFGYQYDPTMTSGLWLARTIYKDLMVEDASVFDWWIALSPDLGCSPAADPTCFQDINPLGRNDGLIYFDLNGVRDGDRRLYLTKRYYVLGQFSRYLRPGMKLVPVVTSDARVEALAGLSRSRLVLVLIDLTPAASPPVPIQIDLPDGLRLDRLVTGYMTDPRISWGQAPRATLAGSTVLVLNQPDSVTTYVWTLRGSSREADGASLAR